MTSMVVDASVAAAWMLVDEQDERVDDLMGLLMLTGGLVPSLFWYETRQTFLKAERRQRCSADQTRLFMAELRGLPLRLAPEGRDDIILTLARTHRLSAYDVVYLEAAIAAELPLATADRRLAEAARVAGVAVLGPFATGPLAP